MFGFIKKSLSKTVEAIQTVAPKRKTTFTKDELEDILLEADVSYDLVEIILNEIYQEKITRDILRSKLLATLAYTSYKEPEYTPPFVELIVGVNGAGKTTTISKLAQKYKEENRSVLLGAGDTFRAAAIEQLTLWANKLDIPIVATKQGHDSSAVAYDAISSAKAKGIDHVIIDTAGRLHTQTNLANELKKINRICDKAHEGTPHRTVLIIDGTQGNSAIEQAKAFNEMIGVDGIIITKLDGTAKGGSVFSIAYALELPILYVGTGEQPQDLVVFDKYEFVDSLLDALFEEQENIPSKVEEELSNQKENIVEMHNEISQEDTQQEKQNNKEQLLEDFLQKERLIILKKIDDNTLVVNYANTPVDTQIIFSNGTWSYK